MTSECQTWVMEGSRRLELDALVKAVDAAVTVVQALLSLQDLLPLVDGVGGDVLIIILVTTLLEIKCDQGTILTPI